MEENLRAAKRFSRNVGQRALSAHDITGALAAATFCRAASEHAVGTFLQVTKNKVSKTVGALPAVSVSPENAHWRWVVRLIDQPNRIKTAFDIVVSETKLIVCVGHCTVARDSRNDATILSQ